MLIEIQHHVYNLNKRYKSRTIQARLRALKLPGIVHPFLIGFKANGNVSVTVCFLFKKRKIAYIYEHSKYFSSEW